MAADGSLHDIGFGRDCSGWMEEWVAEAKGLASGDIKGEGIKCI